MLSIAFGVVLGHGLAVMRSSRLAPVRGVSWFYIWFMRGRPVLLQPVVLYDALPPLGIKLDSFTTAVLGFSLNEARFARRSSAAVLSLWIAVRRSPAPR